MQDKKEYLTHQLCFRAIISLLFLHISITSFGQTAIIKGIVRDSVGRGLEDVIVGIQGGQIDTSTNSKGRFELTVPSDKTLIISFYLIGFNPDQITVTLKNGEVFEVNRTLKGNPIDLRTHIVEGKREREPMIIKIDPHDIDQIPSVSGNFEDVLATLPGVVKGNELSSTYSVRGGNYDENLVYVNDIEIYRPFLVRSGQQEGLSFINGDLVESIAFSAGGFSAMYGDKLSSVLDIKYKRPTKFAGSAYLSFLGGGFHLEGINKKKSISYLLGVRQKSNQFLLKNLDTKGDYKPSFTDVQSLVSFKLSDKTELSFLGNYSYNRYEVIPSDRETEFGSINEALKFTVFFEGKELDRYSATQGALTLSHEPNHNLKLRLITGAYYSLEKEYFDVIGAYSLDELERDLGSSEFGSVAFNRGVGAFLNHARNDLDATVVYAEHKGLYIKKKSTLSWGIKAQNEKINDEIDEWVYRDSSDFAVPHPADHPGDTLFVDQQIVVNDMVKSSNTMNTNRYNSFFQITHDIDTNVTLTVGARATYWDFNNEFDFSPRASISWKPEWKKRMSFRAAVGYYYQPPFYRELRNLQGALNDEIKSQRSIHFVLGNDYQFLAWGREFKMTTEVYYKMLNDLITYKVDNLRLRYFATNNSKGYAYGADMRINGEFVTGIESWFSVSYLKTEEDIQDDYKYKYYNSEGEQITSSVPPQDTASITKENVGYIPRPTDQRFTFSFFFQDYLPKFPTFKMHMTLVFGTGLPFGPPGTDRYKDILRMPTYRRVDIGFSKIIIDEDKANTSRIPIVKNLTSMVFGLEVFNLLQVNNTVSYTWITDVTGKQYAVPNYLSSRLINARLNVKF